jgi:hypothetical protein
VPAAVASGQAVPVGSIAPDQSMSFSIVLPLHNPSGLTSLLSQLYDPSSPNYRHFLSVQQFTDQFGPTVEDYQAVVAFAQAQGLTVTDTPANRLIVPVTGSVAQINQAFNVTMRVYQHPTESRTFYSPDREPSLNLGTRVAHITGLNNFSLPQPRLKQQTASGQAIANVLGSGPGGSYLGSDMRAAYYGATTLTGTGQAVGILEFGGYSLSDVNATFSGTGQTYSVPINNVLLDGATGAAAGDDAEQVLDIVQAIGMAPGLSQVRVYIGSTTVLDDASIFNSMATENIARQISVSWGWVPDDPSVDDVFFQEFAAQGQTVFVASGDDGAFDAAISPYFYPSEDAYITAVGATHLTTTGAGGAWVSETAWNSQRAGSGGGISPDGISIPSCRFRAESNFNRLQHNDADRSQSFHSGQLLRDHHWNLRQRHRKYNNESHHLPRDLYALGCAGRDHSRPRKFRQIYGLRGSAIWIHGCRKLCRIRPAQRRHRILCPESHFYQLQCDDAYGHQRSDPGTGDGNNHRYLRHTSPNHVACVDRWRRADDNVHNAGGDVGWRSGHVYRGGQRRHFDCRGQRRVHPLDDRTGAILRCHGGVLRGWSSSRHSAVDQRGTGRIEFHPWNGEPQLQGSLRRHSE